MHTPSPPIPDWRSLWGVLAIQTQNAFNDKFAQFVLLGLAVVALPREQAESYPHLLGLMLSLPFVLFAPLAGWLSDRHSKRSVLLGCLYTQVAIIFVIAVALKNQHFTVATAGFFLLAVQSAFFSPAKTGILKELVGSAKLAVASGWLQMLAIVGILAGSFLGGLAYEKSYHRLGGETWGAAFLPIVTICALSVGALVVGHSLRRTPPAGASRFHPSLFVQHFGHLGSLFKQRPMRLTALGIAFFWFAGAFAQLLVIQVGIEIAPDPEQAATISGKFQAYVGIGIAIGSLVVAILSSQRIELGIVPAGGAGLALSSAVAAFSPMASATFALSLVLIGFSGALFLVPLSAFLQDLADPAHRGRVLSASALVDSIACLVGIGLQHVLVINRVPISVQFFLLALLSFAASIYVARLLPSNLIRFLALTAFRIVYRVTAVDHHKIPRTGGALLLPNHLSYIDAFVLSAACTREIRFVIFDHYYKHPLLRPFLKLFGVVPISAKRAKDAIRVISDALEDGDMVCLFPEGQLTRTGCLSEIKKGFELMARKSGAPVVPAYMDGVWGSIFSFERGRFRTKVPHRLQFRIRVFFGDPIPARQASAAVVRQSISQLSADALDSRPQLEVPLAGAIARSLHQKSWRTSLVEYAGRRPTSLSRAAVYATAVSLGERWSESIGSSKVAVVIPESSTAVLVHLGLIFAGKIPVSVPLNNPSGPDALKEVLGTNGIDTVITLEKLPAVLTTHYFPENILDITSELKAIPSGDAFLTSVAAYLRPAAFTPLPKRSAPALAYIYRSGQTLSLVEIPARRALAQFYQIDATSLYRPGDVLLARAPHASALGLHIGILYPLLKPLPLVHLPANSDSEKSERALREQKVTIVSGQIPLPPSFTPRLHIGTPQSPALASDRSGTLLTLPIAHPDAKTVTAQFQAGTKPGTDGRLLPALVAPTPDQPLHLFSPSLPEGGITLPRKTTDPEGFVVPLQPN